jgi:hypothetical protein
MVLILLLGGVVLLAAGGLAWWHFQRQSAGAFHSCRCPHCEQKVRYPAARAGRHASCPSCRRQLTLPSVPQEAPPADGSDKGFRVGRRQQTPAG